MDFIRRLCAKTRPRDLIGPPDPISNIRPVIVGGRRPHTSGKTHPYSLTEFSTEEEDADLQWRIERDSLNAFNHSFWTDSNSRFMQGKQDVLARFQTLPTEDHFTTRDRETALSSFYSQWSIQESARQTAYTAEWNSRNRAVIRLAMRRQLRIWRDTFRDAFVRR